MERRFDVRKERLLEECRVYPGVFRGMLQRLERFVEPFADCLCRQEQWSHARTYVGGLFSDLKYKNTESIAYRHDQDRKGLQHFIGDSQWDHRPLLNELARQVGQHFGQADGVLVLDPAAFPKKGTESASTLIEIRDGEKGPLREFLRVATAHRCVEETRRGKIVRQ